MPLVDSYGRQVSYLRLSVTGRCNLHCVYCRPAAGKGAEKPDDLLGYDGLMRVAETAVSLGVEKIRITGGEPLLRAGITNFVADLASIDGLKQLVLTTNGQLLAELADGLKEAGLQRINISLDSLDAATYAAITRGGELRRVMEGLAAAEQAGFSSVKINVVVMRGINDHELTDFAALSLERPFDVRFIELMPTRGGLALTPVSGTEIMAVLSEHYRLQPVAGGRLDGPSRSFRIAGAAGTVSLITPLSNHFCHTCNRLRLTSDGLLKGCLFGMDTMDIKPYLHTGDLPGLEAAIRAAVRSKPSGHRLGDQQNRRLSPLRMSSIGG